MMTLKIGEKEYNIKFAYEPTVKGHIISRLTELERETKGSGGSAVNIEDMMLLIPDMLLIGLQRYHKEEFGYNYDTEEGKDKMLISVYGLMDEYFDSDDADIAKLYNDLQEEMLRNSFLSGLVQKGMEKNP